ncbi:DUF2341 domain-containing protein [Candidatus Beckwithbacteria bacterium]|nr:DUF2341 domain-containing protein [Candidatus Beckwithbacteria bacterium]
MGLFNYSNISKIVLFIAVGLAFTSQVYATGESWLDGYTYRKQITITGSSAGSQTNYQVKITVNKNAGTDTSATVYLNNNVLDSFNDIRFTQSDGQTLLDYWIESSTTDTVTVWVECDSIPESPSTATFYLYYGDGDATSLSSAINTFPFYDNFDDNSVNTSLWDVAQSGSATYNESGGYARVSGSSSGSWVLAYFRTKTAFGPQYAIRAKQYFSASSANFCSYSGFADNTHTSYFDLANAVILDNNKYNWASDEHNLVTYASGSGVGQAAGNQNASWKVFEYRRYTDNAQIMYDDISATAITTPASIPTANLYAGMWVNPGAGASGYIYTDWFLVRKYVNPEPSMAFGEESTYTPSYVITNPPESTQITLASDEESDVTSSGQTGIQTVAIAKSTYRVAAFSVDFSADRDWTDLTVDSDGEKAVLHYDGGFTSIPGSSGESFSLYIPDNGGSRVRICPNASSLAQVTSGCSNEYFLTTSDSSVSKTTVNGIDYWVIAGLSGTGGEEAEAPSGGSSSSYQAPLFTDLALYFTLFLSIIGGFKIIRKTIPLA